jgi:hypothetical protein
LPHGIGRLNTGGYCRDFRVLTGEEGLTVNARDLRLANLLYWGKVEFYTMETAPMKLTSLFSPRSAAIALLAVVSTTAVAPSQAWAKKYPEPSRYPLPNAWYLTFKHGIPKRIVVDVPGQKLPTAYWYLTYTVTNDSSKEVDFLPDFQMVTQDGAVHQADKNIPLPVFQAIKKEVGNDLLVSATKIAGPLHQGEDQARDGVAIWEEPMARMGAFALYVGGLNSEFVKGTDNDGNPINDAEGHPVTLRKTLELNYVIWGDEVKPGLDDVQKKPEHWVMR